MNQQRITDLDYLSYAECICGDYNEFLKKIVLPIFKKRFPLKLREVRVLNMIASAGRPPSASQISYALRQDPATITRSLVILIGKGYILSEEDFLDGRSRLLKTTPEGAEAAMHFSEIFSDLVDKATHSTNGAHFNHDPRELPPSLDLVAKRAHALRESKRILRSNVNDPILRAFR